MSGHTAPDSSSRTYLAGLPVAIEVHNDGRVTYSIDVSEAADAIREGDWGPDSYDPSISEEQAEQDAAVVEAKPGGWTPPVTARRMTLGERLAESPLP